jgi:hypothetical protein
LRSLGSGNTPTLGYLDDPGELRSNESSSPPPASTGLYSSSYEQDWNLVQQHLVGQIGSLPLGTPVDGSSSYGLPLVEPSPCDTFHGRHREGCRKADLYAYSHERLERVPMGHSLGPSPFEAPGFGSSSYPQVGIPTRTEFSRVNTDLTDFLVPSANGE